MKFLTAKIWLISLLMSGVLWAMPPLKIQVQPADLKTVSQDDTLSVLIEIADKWHLTADKPLDEFLIPLESHLKLSGAELGSPIYPEPKIKEFSNLGIKAAWFEDSLKIQYVVKNLSAGEEPSFQFRLYYQACDDKICLSPTDTIIASSNSTSQSNSNLNATGAVTSQSKGEAAQGLLQGSSTSNSNNYLLMLLLAFVGGLILNLMPCVLPVLGLKIFSLIRQSGESRTKLIQLGVTYTFGVLASFWALAFAVILAQKAGSAAGWGFQFTHPGFVLFMILVVFLFALNLLGMFEITLNSKAMTAMDSSSNGEGLPKAFLNGAFMTLIATPCSAPFLGTGMGYALSQPPQHLLIFFTVAGFGLAIPFLLISFFPGFADKLPRPGAWMNRLKEFMGFTLLATMLWLLFVLTKQVGIHNGFWILLWLLFVSFIVWVWKNWGEGYEVGKLQKTLVLVISVVLMSVTYIIYVSPLLAKDETVIEFDESMYEIPLSQGKWVFVDYTADWCITCKVNEAQVISKPDVQAYFNHSELEFLIADYTRGNDLIDAHLKKFKRAGVPMYILMGPMGETHVFPEILTQKNLIEIFQKYGLKPKQ